MKWNTKERTEDERSERVVPWRTEGGGGGGGGEKKKWRKNGFCNDVREKTKVRRNVGTNEKQNKTKKKKIKKCEFGEIENKKEIKYIYVSNFGNWGLRRMPLTPPHPPESKRTKKKRTKRSEKGQTMPDDLSIASSLVSSGSVEESVSLSLFREIVHSPSLKRVDGGEGDRVT